MTVIESRRTDPTIGRSVDRADVAAKVDGSFEYSNDASVPGMLFGATVRSTHAHARIASVSVDSVMSDVGVVRVFTAADVPGAELVGHIIADQPVFASDLVRYEGEPIAFVVATSQQAAWRAADSIVVEYEPLAGVFDAEIALDDAAPAVHPAGNLIRRLPIRSGGPCTGASVEIEGTWFTGRQDQAFLGPESGLALPDADGGVTLHIATQDLHADRNQIAAALALPVDKVRVELAGIGGAFGGREDVSCQIHLCLAALALDRAVKTTYRRRESFLGHPKRHPARLHYRVGAHADGTLSYVWARIRLDGGAYASTSMPVIGIAGYHAAGPYRCPSVDVVAESVYTNNLVSGAMRGFGAVQACFGIESAMDMLADKLGLDPIELRRRNALRPGDRFPTSGQQLGASTPVLDVIDRCAALPLPPPRDPSPGAHPYDLPGGTGCTTHGESVRRGVGFAVGVKSILYGEGTAEWCEARVRMDRSGVRIESAAAEVGQGIVSGLIQVASDELDGIEVTVASASSRFGYAGSSSASRQTWMSAGAVRIACHDLRRRLCERLGIDDDDLDLLDLDFDEVMGDDVLDGDGLYRAPATEPGDPTTGQGVVHVAWMFVAHRAVVDVDTELGTIRVVQIATSQDVGRAINPREVRGQIIGGISQGIGLALNEDVVVRDGIVLNASFTDYLMPTAGDMPPVLVDLVEVSEPSAPYGLKGVGEAPSL
ncbi:xanthine dehydrogenase subunit D [soil metagenome]